MGADLCVTRQLELELNGLFQTLEPPVGGQTSLYCRPADARLTNRLSLVQVLGRRGTH